MNNDEVKEAMPHLCEKWAEETKQPWPPDSLFEYSFISFWSWLESNYWSYMQFRAKLNAQYVMEIWFNKIMKQTWRD